MADNHQLRLFSINYSTKEENDATTKISLKTIDDIKKPAKIRNIRFAFCFVICFFFFSFLNVQFYAFIDGFFFVKKRLYKYFDADEENEEKMMKLNERREEMQQKVEDLKRKLFRCALR